MTTQKNVGWVRPEAVTHQDNAEWPVLSIEQIADVNPRIDKSSIPDDLPVSFVPMPAVGAGDGSIRVDEARPAREVKKGFTGFLEGDVLFAKITPCMENGKMAVVPKLVNGFGFGSTEFHVLRPKAGIEAKYLYYYVSSQSFRGEAERYMTGAVGQKRVSTTYLKEAKIPVAPLDQQKHIVAEIEKQFSRLDEAVANLKRVKANLKRYKAAVLKAAVEGRLVADDATTGKLEWERKQIGVAIESLDQGWSPQCENEPAQSDDVWAVMKTTAVQPLRYLDAENKRLPDKLEPRTHLELMPGDLLITRAGPRSRVGVACLVRATRPRVMLCDKVYRLRTKQNVALPAYLELVLNSPDVVEAINELKTGISDSGVNLTQTRFKELLVPIPSIAEQERVLAEVDRRLSLLRETETQVDANLQRAERMRQSLLSSMFTGKLVTRIREQCA